MSLLDALIEDELLLPPPIVGTSPAIAAREIWICKRTDGGVQLVFGDGTQDSPFDGSTADKFDFIMATKIPDSALVRIGPGEFQTRGGTGWSPKNGRIVGSGMYGVIGAYWGHRGILGS